MAHVIVVGNEKGGSGKSTTAMHVATALARIGHPVATIDLDLRQTSLARYLENRAAFAAASGITLPMPVHHPLPATGTEEERMAAALDAAEAEAEFVVIDCPGSHTRLSQVAHMAADTLVTPLNDSFVDFDLLGKVDPDGRVLGPSIYSEMVWSARQARARGGLRPIDWIVVRNRLGTQAMINKRKVGGALAELSKRIGFRVAAGFSERVIFRELFPKGLTLLDLREAGVGGGLSLSGVAARQELRELIAALDLPGVRPRI
jgi:chromosome partitioning protein